MESVSRRPGLVLVVLALAFAWPACRPPFLGSEITYGEAKDELERLIDGGLASGLNQRENSLVALEEEDSCERSIFAPAEGVTPVYAYHFAYEPLEPDVDKLVDGVTSYWEAQGLQLDPSEPEPGVRSVFATSNDGYSLEVFVNRGTGMALIQGSGPCVAEDNG